MAKALVDRGMNRHPFLAANTNETSKGASINQGKP